MKVHEGIVLGARLGGRAEAAGIVKAYEGELYAFALASTRNAAEAEDAVQEIFAKVFSSLGGLRESARFESWLWQVARNELASRHRASRSRPIVVDLDPDEVPALGAEAAGGAGGTDRPGEGEAELLSALYATLNPDEAMAAALRYGGGFSVREIALVCGVGESTAKSRLDGARRRMRRAASRRRDTDPAGTGRQALPLHRFRIPFGLEERIMENVETLRLGASVIERLSNDDQMWLAVLCRRGEAFDERVLGAVGRVSVDGDAGVGAEFVRRVGARLTVRELASTFNYVDRYTEIRVIKGLETVDPETSEELKRNMFVFEDFVLFDAAALALVVGEAGLEVFALGLAACGVAEREEILGNAGEDAAGSLREAMSRARWSPESGRAAQEEAVAATRRLDLAGRLKVVEGEAFKRGFVFTAAG